jgi:hypothetical protein
MKEKKEFNSTQESQNKAEIRNLLNLVLIKQNIGLGAYTDGLGELERKVFYFILYKALELNETTVSFTMEECCKAVNISPNGDTYRNMCEALDNLISSVAEYKVRDDDNNFVLYHTLETVSGNDDSKDFVVKLNKDVIDEYLAIN